MNDSGHNKSNGDSSDAPSTEDLPSLLDTIPPADPASTENAELGFVPSTDNFSAMPALDMNGDLAPLADSGMGLDLSPIPESPAEEIPSLGDSPSPDEPVATDSPAPEIAQAAPAQTSAPLTVSAPEPETTQAIDAEFPWTLRITGHLRALERDRLLELIADHAMGIREMDLEPQLEAGRILIPRISEYAAVLLVGALRSTSAKVEVYPSDQEELFARPTAPIEVRLSTAKVSGHPAEKIPVTSDHTLPELGENFQVIDTLSASLALATQIVHAKESVVYQKAIDDLKKELQYKAFYKGAQGLVNLQIQLIPLSPLTHYRAVVMATAITAPAQAPKGPTP